MRIALSLLLVLFFSTCLATGFDTSLIPYRQGEKWGYCDRHKNIVIRPQFTKADFFSDGSLTTVQVDSSYCVINRRGNIIYKGKHFIAVTNNGTNFIASETYYDYHIYDSTGKPVTKVYTDIEGFNTCGYAIITTNYTKKGLMDKSFREVLPPVYSSIEFFSKDLVLVHKDNVGYSLVDLASGWQMADAYDRIYPPHEGLMMVKKGDYYGFINEKGKVIIPIQYARVCADGNPLCFGTEYNESTYADFHLDGFYDGIAVVVSGETVFYINKKGKRLFHFRMDYGYGFYNGRAWVNDGGQWGIIDRNGKFIIQPYYSAPTYSYAKELTALEHMRDGMLAVNDGSKFGYADSTGRLVIPCRYSLAAAFYNGLAAVSDSGRYGFINKTGDTIIPLRYKWIEGAGIYDTDPFASGCAAAQLQDGRWAIIDKKGKQLIPFLFDEDNNIYFENGLAEAQASGKRYIFDTAGKIVYTFPSSGFITQYTADIWYSYDQKCFVNIRNNMAYRD